MQKYPFDQKFSSYLFTALGLAIWVFAFLFLTEPLDVNQFKTSEKLIYLPLYGMLAAICYLGIYRMQKRLYKHKNKQWTLLSELLFFSMFITITFIVMRCFYLYVVVFNEPNPYSLGYYFTSIFLPAVLVIFPIVAIARYALGKYASKKVENSKLFISGDGNYEGIRLLESDLILLEASDNYVEVHYQSQGVLKKQLIRARLSRLEKEHTQLLRTHRSYLINRAHFTSLKTQNNKLGVILTHDIFVPVSKTYISQVKEAFSFATN